MRQPRLGNMSFDSRTIYTKEIADTASSFPFGPRVRRAHRHAHGAANARPRVRLPAPPSHHHRDSGSATGAASSGPHSAVIRALLTSNFSLTSTTRLLMRGLSVHCHRPTLVTELRLDALSNLIG